MKDLAMNLCCIRFPNCFCRNGNREITTGVRRDSVVLTGRNPSLTGIQILPSSLNPAKSDEDLDSEEGRRNIFCCANLWQNRGLFFLGSLGALFMAVASAIYLLNPLEIIAKSQLTLREGSFSDATWRKPPIKVGVKIFIFNYTNTEAFLRGEEKLKVEEIGPYVYTETLENNNVTYHPNGTVTYSPQRTVVVNKELTVGDPKTDWVIVPDVVFLGVASYLADHSLLTNMAFNTFASFIESKAFINITVEDYLWGYDDPLIHYASKIIPETIHFSKFGYMDRMFDEGPNVVSMNLNEQLEVSRDGKEVRPLSIDLFNGSPGLRHWGYKQDDNSTHKKCNTLQGYATEGILFPRKMTPKEDFVIYRKSFCRTLQIVFDHEGVTDAGIRTYHYKLRDDTFDNTNPDNSCYCDKTKGPCLKRGLSNISPCYYNIPVAVSYPHFYDADPSLLEDIDGLNPNKEDHGTFAIIQPDMGAMMRAHSRIQSNLIMRNTRYNGKAAPFNNMVIPLFWTDFYFDELPGNINSIIILLLIIAPILQTVVMVAFLVAGIILTIVTLLNAFSKQKPRKLTEMWTPSGYENVQTISIIRRESLGAA